MGAACRAYRFPPQEGEAAEEERDREGVEKAEPRLSSGSYGSSLRLLTTANNEASP
jgi:hypothetical protein